MVVMKKGITFSERGDGMSSDAKNIRRLLLSEMKDGIYAQCDRLPRETVLSEELGISRTQLRDTLADLEREGFITRRQGIGTVINRHVLAVTNRMDIETEFLDIFRLNGREPKVAAVEAVEGRASTYVAGKLKIPEGTPVLKLHRLYTTDGKPALCCEDVLEKSRVRDGYTQADVEGIIFEFLQKFCGVSAYMDLTELHAVAATGRLAQVMQVPEGTPLLNMEEVDFDIEGNTIFYSSQYFAEGMFQHTVLRKKL